MPHLKLPSGNAVETASGAVVVREHRCSRTGIAVLCAATFLVPHASLAAGMPSSAYCSCLESAPPESGGKRVGGRAFSMQVPGAAIQRRIESIDSEAYEWVDGWTHINSSYSFVRTVHFDRLPSDECAIRIGGHWIAIDALDQDEREGFLASFEADRHPDGAGYTLTIGVRAHDSRTACTVGAAVLHSVTFVNDWKRIEVVAIAPDRSSVTLRNEIGETRKARVGDVVTRDYGKVTKIGPTSVEITELVSDGAGGWLEPIRGLTVK